MSAEHRVVGRDAERRRIEAIYWAGVLILAGLVFVADSVGVLPGIGGADAWSWIFLGAGVYSLLGSLYRQIMPDILNPTGFDWFWGVIFAAVGLSGFAAIEIAWSLVLIVAGAAILVRTLMYRD